MNEIEVKEIQEAITAADDALDHLESAKSYLSSAKNWGIVDMLGGGLISGLVKHSKMGNAEREIEAARSALKRFSKELRDVSGYSSIHVNEFLTIADLFFDGFLVDAFTQSKISEARKQCDDAIRQVTNIRFELIDKLNAGR